MKTKRHVSWKNVGFVVSWLCAIVSIGYIFADFIYTIITGHRISSHEPWIGIICFGLMIWCFGRNKYGFIEYIKRWRERHK
jgi:hypothetical protein